MFSASKCLVLLKYSLKCSFKFMLEVQLQQFVLPRATHGSRFGDSSPRTFWVLVDKYLTPK